MSSLQHHLIGRIVLEVDTDDSTDAWELQENLSQLIQQRAMADMEQLFNQWTGVDGIVRLEELKIELPPIDYRRLDDEFVPKLIEALKQALSDRISKPIPQNRSLSIVPKADSTEVTTQAPTTSAWVVLLHFLDYGRLPWWQQTQSLTTWITRWEATLQSDTDWRTPLQQCLSTTPTARQRLVSQFPTTFLHALLRQMQPAWTPWPTLLAEAKMLMRSLGSSATVGKSRPGPPLKLTNSTLQHLERQAWLLIFSQIRSNTTVGESFPYEQWFQAWLEALVETIRQGRGLAIARDNLSAQSRAILEKTPPGTQAPPLAIEQQLKTLITDSKIANKQRWLAAIDRLGTPTVPTVSARPRMAAVTLPDATIQDTVVQETTVEQRQGQPLARNIVEPSSLTISEISGPTSFAADITAAAVEEIPPAAGDDSEKRDDAIATPYPFVEPPALTKLTAVTDTQDIPDATFDSTLSPTVSQQLTETETASEPPSSIQPALPPEDISAQSVSPQPRPQSSDATPYPFTSPPVLQEGTSVSVESTPTSTPETAISTDQSFRLAELTSDINLPASSQGQPIGLQQDDSSVRTTPSSEITQPSEVSSAAPGTEPSAIERPATDDSDTPIAAAAESAAPDPPNLPTDFATEVNRLEPPANSRQQTDPEQATPQEGRPQPTKALSDPALPRQPGQSAELTSGTDFSELSPTESSQERLISPDRVLAEDTDDILIPSSESASSESQTTDIAELEPGDVPVLPSTTEGSPLPTEATDAVMAGPEPATSFLTVADESALSGSSGIPEQSLDETEVEDLSTGQSIDETDIEPSLLTPDNRLTSETRSTEGQTESTLDTSAAEQVTGSSLDEPEDSEPSLSTSDDQLAPEISPTEDLLETQLEPSLGDLDSVTSVTESTLAASNEEAAPESEASDVPTLLPDESWMLPLMANPPKRATTANLSTDEMVNGIYLNEAGLVLLHPFLKIYFENVGLLAENSFRNEYTQQLAIALLHYLATGETVVPEYELVLPKVLCGWPLDEPVVYDLELPETALAEGANLLQTVINYWEALKNTSPDGLREGFLQRQGKLTCPEQGNWRLRVEQKAIDVLFSRLPWGIGVVKLPWMEVVLVVEWT